MKHSKRHRVIRHLDAATYNWMIEQIYRHGGPTVPEIQTHWYRTSARRSSFRCLRSRGLTPKFIGSFKLVCSQLRYNTWHRDLSSSKLDVRKKATLPYKIVHEIRWYRASSVLKTFRWPLLCCIVSIIIYFVSLAFSLVSSCQLSTLHYAAVHSVPSNRLMVHATLT